jgi:CheY-like chemotaxis protein
MESVGRLAGGVAHDMNNVLSAIMAVAAIIQYKGGPEAKHAETILKASERGRNLVKGLLEFARKEVPEATLLDLNDLVRKEAELMAGTTLNRIQVELDLAPELPMIMGSATALSTALMNLCVNAVDAMPDNGTLRLHTSFSESAGVELLVEDTGEGMTPDVLARAMEPFFTTKPVGKGTGLGLSMVFGTVQSHGGNLDIQSELGRGTRIRIRLPIVSDHRLGLLTGPIEPAFSSTQVYKILLVDDDPMIRETSLALLEFLGHQVTAVRGGQEALDLIRRSSGWDVVVLDLNMPGLDGLGTLKRLRNLQPTLPVIMATGYADEDTQRELVNLGRVVLLLKPYSLHEIQGILLGTLG